MSQWKLHESHAASADGAQCDRCFVMAREYASTMPCLYRAAADDPARPSLSPEFKELAAATARQWTDDHAEQLEPVIERALHKAYQLGVAHQRSVDAPYLQHHKDCNWFNVRTLQNDCTCGLAALVDQTGEGR